METPTSIEWRQECGGHWYAELPGHRFHAAKHQNTWPVGWRVYDNGEQVIFERTLTAAQEWVERTYCKRGWTVHHDSEHDRYCVAITVGGAGPLTHHEALTEAKRLNAERLRPAEVSA